jgi:hypothetical protein
MNFGNGGEFCGGFLLPAPREARVSLGFRRPEAGLRRDSPGGEVPVPRHGESRLTVGNAVDAGCRWYVAAISALGAPVICLDLEDQSL